MQGMYLMNVYSIVNVQRGLNPTFTYRTVLAKKRNTKIEKIQKCFRAIKKPAELNRRAHVQIKMGKKIETYDFSVIGLYEHISGSK